LEVTLSEPVPYFYKLLVNPAMSPLPKPPSKNLVKMDAACNIVTNGAYKLKDWVVNERIVMSVIRTIGITRKPSLISYLPAASSEVTDVNRYRSGEIDMTYNNMPIELFQKLKKEIPKEVHVDPYLYLLLRNQQPESTVHRLRVRTALKAGSRSSC
jgi:oligopeptide transport system substrate-binding protein